ncbi:MAG: GNAT family N-acetyltransferase [Chloroflexota bacterium]
MNASTNLEFLTKIEQSLRAAGREGREVVEIDRFELFIAASDDFYINYAVPTSSHETNISWDSAVKTLIQTFANYKRRPRLEMMSGCHPGLGEILEAHGISEAGRMPVMVLVPTDFKPFSLATLPQLQIADLTTFGEDDLKRYLRQMQVGYGGPGDESALGWLPTFKHGLQNGSLTGAALLLDGEIVSGATVQIGAGIGELAGVWTDPTVRQRGFAYRLCHALLTGYFQKGYILCWLSAAEGAQRLYQKLGFKEVGIQTNYGLELK